MKILFLFLIQLFIITSVSAGCIENRAAFDIGSGTTKLLVAEFDSCKQILVKTVFEDRRPIAFNDSLDHSADYRLDDHIFQKANQTLLELKKLATDHKAKKFFAVATSVFRKAKNGSEFAKKLSQTTKIKIKIITQEEEALLGHQVAIKTVSSPVNPKNSFVWDIGGGSMQMIVEQKKKYDIYNGELASVTFKNMVIEAIENKNSSEITTPNPLNSNWENAYKLAKSYAKIHVPNLFKNLSEKFDVIGIGGVHNNSVLRLIGTKNSFYTKEEVLDALKKYSSYSDDKLEGDYRATDITNLALVAGFMDELKIQKIYTVKTSMGHGILFWPKYW